MTKEDKIALEVKVEDLRKKADEAAQAAAGDPGNDDLQKKAETAEDALATAEAELATAVVDSEPEPEEGEEEGDDNEHIDFEEQLRQLEGEGEEPKPKTEKEKAAAALFHNAKRFKELGGNIADVLKDEVVPPTPPTEAPPASPPTPPTDGTLTRDDLVEIEFGKIAKSEAERKVYLHHYKHSIVKTGNITADMENAMLIANKGKILRSFGELRRTEHNRPRPGNGGPGRPPAPEVRTPTISSSEETVLKRRGFQKQADGSWKGKRYTLRYDTKKKGWVETKNT